MSKTIMRVVKNKDNPYLILNKTSSNDERLSWKAKGIHVYLLGLPDDWKIYIDELKLHAKDGKVATAKGIKELIEYKYIVRNLIHNLDGKFKGYEYLVFEVPQEPTETTTTTVSRKSVNGKSVNGKSTTTKYLNKQNINKTKTSSTKLTDDEVSFSDYFTEKTKASISKKQLKLLIKKYGTAKLRSELDAFLSKTKHQQLKNIAGAFISYLKGDFIPAIKQDSELSNKDNFTQRKYNSDDFEGHYKKYDE